MNKGMKKKRMEEEEEVEDVPKKGKCGARYVIRYITS
jgi:hypothetical protein